MKNSELMGEKLSIIFYNDVEPQKRKYIKEEDYGTKANHKPDCRMCNLGNGADAVLTSNHLNVSCESETAKSLCARENWYGLLHRGIGPEVSGRHDWISFCRKPWPTRPEASHIRCVRRIGEYQLYGAVLRNHAKNAKTLDGWELGDEKIIAAYVESVQTAANSDATKRLRILSGYAASLQGESPVYTKHRLATLRFYFRFLKQKSILECDWSFAVPKVIAPKNLNVPALWSREELERLLKSIDRDSPAGKRDYAIILLVVQLGLRIADVSALRLDSLKWERNELEFIQHKTGNRVTQPLLEDVGWAIIDYIKYGRPKAESPFVFLTANAPYTPMKSGSIGCILDRHRARCGIEKKNGAVSGMHSLRHAMARRLLEQGTELSTVANIMGHTSYASTSPYLKVDIEGLRECALSLGEVLTDA